MTAWGRILAAVTAIALGFFPGFGAGGNNSSGEGQETEPVPGSSRCLVIGYDDFATMPDTVPCSANNAEIMNVLFLDFVPEVETVVRRVNEPGTVAGLETLIRETFACAAPGDTSYLYMSTHGVIWKEDDGTGMALMVSDGILEEALTPARLRAILDGIPGNKVLILDACHSGAVLEEFSAPEYSVLASSATEEESYFWHTENAEESGTGYFTTALEGALRASYPGQIDPDGNGEISLRETLDRVAGIYGASRVQGSPDHGERMLFRMPEDRGTPERILALAFDPLIREEDTLTLPFHFEVTAETRLEYRVVPKINGKWDFSRFATMPDKERSGTVRGRLSPGTKDRKIRISVSNLGGEGEALLQIISLRGLHSQVPVLEGTWVIGDEQWTADSE